MALLTDLPRLRILRGASSLFFRKSDNLIDLYSLVILSLGPYNLVEFQKLPYTDDVISISLGRITRFEFVGVIVCQLYVTFQLGNRDTLLSIARFMPVFSCC